MLENLDLHEDDMNTVRVEQVQAWLLLAFYEFARCNYRRAWITAGRAFRLVQLARLHEVDISENATECADAVSREEKRRTFWVAYYLDRLLCIRNRRPLTLIEEMVGSVTIPAHLGDPHLRTATNNIMPDLYQTPVFRPRLSGRQSRSGAVSGRGLCIRGPQPLVASGRVCHFAHDIWSCSIAMPGPTNATDICKRITGVLDASRMGQKHAELVFEFVDGQPPSHLSSRADAVLFHHDGARHQNLHVPDCRVHIPRGIMSTQRGRVPEPSHARGKGDRETGQSPRAHPLFQGETHFFSSTWHHQNTN